MKRIALVLIGVLTLGVMPTAEAATLTKVTDDRDVDEGSVAVSGTYFAWSQNSIAHPSHYNSFVRPVGGGDPVRVNPRGTRSYSVGIDGSTVVYQVSRHGHGNLALYDAATDTGSALPAAVNSDKFENRPSLSGDWLLFTRLGRRTKVILYNLTTDEQRILHKGRGYVVSDQVNGDWATFETCAVRRGALRRCNLFRYQISTEGLEKIENPDLQQYAGGIDVDGTVYMTRAGGHDVWRCGLRARIVRYPVGGPGTVIARIRRGFDAFVTFAFDEPGGSTTAYLIRNHCPDASGGIYKIADADTTS